MHDTEAVLCHIELNGTVLRTTADVIIRPGRSLEGLSIDRRLSHRQRLDNLGSLPGIRVEVRV